MLKGEGVLSIRRARAHSSLLRVSFALAALSCSALFVSIVVPGILPGVASKAAAGEISGANRLEVWVDDSLRAAAYLSKFDVQYQSDNWLVGARFEYDEESIWDPDRGAEITRRYAEYGDETFTLRGGNYYATFGRGLLLRAMEEDEVRLDRDMDGLHGMVSYRGLEGQGFVGRPRNDITYERDDMLSGLDAAYQLAGPLRVGGGYVRLDAGDPPGEPGSDSDDYRRPIEELAGGRIQFTHGIFDVYFEGAQRIRRGERNPRGGWTGLTGSKPKEGEAYYGAVTVGIPGYVLLLEGKNYERFDFDYSTPPPVNKDGAPLNNADDEQGFGAVLTASPTTDITLDGNASYAESGDDHDGAERTAAGLTIRKDWWGKGSIQIGGEYVKEDSLAVTTGYWLREYAGPSLEVSYYLTDMMSVAFKGHLYDRTDDDVEYTEVTSDITLSHASGKSITFSIISASEELPHYEMGDTWYLVQLAWSLGYSHELTVKIGEERGGITCSGGVCRYEEPFEGVRIELMSRL